MVWWVVPSKNKPAGLRQTTNLSLLYSASATARLRAHRESGARSKPHFSVSGRAAGRDVAKRAALRWHGKVQRLHNDEDSFQESPEARVSSLAKKPFSAPWH